MIIYMNVMSWISTIISILCGVWLLGLAIFCIVRAIINKVRLKKEMKEDLKEYRKLRKSKYGSDKDDE